MPYEVTVTTLGKLLCAVKHPTAQAALTVGPTGSEWTSIYQLLGAAWGS